MILFWQKILFIVQLSNALSPITKLTSLWFLPPTKKKNAEINFWTVHFSCWDNLTNMHFCLGSWITSNQAICLKRHQWHSKVFLLCIEILKYCGGFTCRIAHTKTFKSWSIFLFNLCSSHSIVQFCSSQSIWWAVILGQISASMVTLIGHLLSPPCPYLKS